MANCCGDKTLRRSVHSTGEVRPPKQTQQDIKNLLQKAYSPNTNRRCSVCGKLMNLLVGFDHKTGATTINRKCPSCGRVNDVGRES